MGNKQFESANLMHPNKVFNAFYVYYIDSFHTEYNGCHMTSLYVADKRVKLDEFTKIIDQNDNWIIFESDYDGTPRQFKGFRTKEAAQELLTKGK